MQTNEAYEDFENVIMSDAVDKLAACYKLDFADENYDDTLDFISKQVIYKLLHLIQDIAIHKFVFNTKHCYEDKLHIYCQCQACLAVESEITCKI